MQDNNTTMGMYQGTNKSKKKITGYLIENQLEHRKYIVPDIRTILSGKTSLSDYECKADSIGVFINELDNKGKRLYVNDNVIVTVCYIYDVANSLPTEYTGKIQYSNKYKVYYIHIPNDTILFQGDHKYTILSIKKLIK